MMFDESKLHVVLLAYKEKLPMHWEKEKYKWKAIEHFRNNWDVNAQDFCSMFLEATSEVDNLLASMRFYPLRMITEFAKVDPEATRNMFISLFDESTDVFTRIARFELDADKLREKYDTGSWKNHYQTPNSISTYLWLRYPDKYYIYKYTEVRALSKELNSDFVPKKGHSETNIRGSFHFYDEVRKALLADDDLKLFLRNHAVGEYYSDPQLVTMMVDFGFFTSRDYANGCESDSDWSFEDYSSGISVEDWIELIKDESIFTDPALQVMKRIMDYGGSATCKQLSVRYGEHPNFYNTNSSRLAERVQKKTGCPMVRGDTNNSKWWPIIYIGRYADNKCDGTYVWKIRDELSEALRYSDLSDISLYANSSSSIGHWWLNASPKYWVFSNIEIGEEERYTSYNDEGNKRRIFANFMELKPGDKIIGYETDPVKKVTALCEVTKVEDGQAFYLKKTANVDNPIKYITLKNAPELSKMEFFNQSNGSLFKLTEGEYDFITELIGSDTILPDENEIQRYTKDEFLDQVFMSSSDYDCIVSLIKNKHNVILQGAPGVGKTFIAKRLAWSMMGIIDDSRIESIQFHQNYSYEDMVMGYRPKNDGFELKDGIFYTFCQSAREHPENLYFFIIDEINRGNLSKIFGELLMLIENDHRNEEVTLAYSGDRFSVPGNICIIGMMNTADRSLAMIDYALRRRFSFFDVEPGFYTDGFIEYQKSLDSELFDSLVECIKDLNRVILVDDSLGKGFCIGHSYLCGFEKSKIDTRLNEVIEYDIIPMLTEYWFDDASKVQEWSRKLRGVFDD